MFKYALQIVFRRKLRTFLTSLGVTISVILLSFIILGMQGLDNLLVNEFTSRFHPNEMVISKMAMGPPGMLPLDSEEGDIEDDKEKEVVIMNNDFIDEIKGIEHIERVNGFVLMMGFEFTVEGFDKKFSDAVMSGWDAVSDEKFLGEFLVGEEELNDGSVYVSVLVADYYDCEPEDLIGLEVDVFPSPASIFSMRAKGLAEKNYKFEIAGVYDSGVDRNDILFTTNDSASILADIGGFGSGDEYLEEVGYDQIVAVLYNEEKVEEVSEYIKDKYDVYVITADDLLSFLQTITSALTFALLLFAVVSGVVAAIGIINTMIMSIYEQTREIGIIKAIGASNSQVLVVFLFQSAFIGLLGGVIGLLVVYTGMFVSDPYIVEALKESNFNLEYFFEFDLVLTAKIIVASILVGIFAGIYPSMKAAKLDPVKALRHD